MEGPCDTCKFYSKRLVQQDDRVPQEICRCSNPDCPDHQSIYVWKLRCPWWAKK